ncbi:methyl-accepting chemotaxis protein [Velocimicrobium porci]|uniref:Methyl-accepting chemotaxis protein n=1 Tax=Velocimicrobium porci TaxID=2606634 RepID=A0A6L5XXD4_9FIRM|nr:methyl-accepting chemotaxis protein [Velocimicrobium porci]MSS63259.1 methyl-accepting chemotaxis protein [Velocimicrobium porci]
MKKQSIKKMALLIVVPTISIAVLVISLLGYMTARKTILTTSNSEMEFCLSSVTEKIQKSLSNNRKVVETIARTVESLGSHMTEEDYGKLLTSSVGTNDETFGGGIWYGENAYKNKQYFSPYCMRENGKVTYFDNYSLGDGVLYTDQDWYKNAMDIKESVVWSEPYYDEFAKISMVTASAPFYNGAGNFMGVATTDIDLTELQKMITSLEIEGGRAFLISAKGVYIADEDSEKLLKQNITEEQNSSLAELGKQILEKKNGTGSYKDGKTKYMVWYSEVPESDWYIVTAVNRKELMKETNALGRNLLIGCIFFIFISTYLVYRFMSRSIVKPLEKLALTTKEIADGNLDVKIDIKSDNEIGVVVESLEKTVAQLQNYIAYINEIAVTLGTIAEGKLVFELQHDYSGEFAKIKEAMLGISSSLTKALTSIYESSERIANGSEQVADNGQVLAEGAVEQTESVDRLANTIKDISEIINNNAEHAGEANEKVNGVGQEILASCDKMNQMTKAINVISEQSKETSRIIQTIEEIASQTNMLSMNAAIEAARAGEAGKGFAVVADQVRELANKSAEAVKETNALIAQTLEAVANGEEMARVTEEALKSVVASSDEVAVLIEKITKESNEQANKLVAIQNEVDQISTVVKNNSDIAEESAGASEELSAQVQMLEQLVGQFELE